MPFICSFLQKQLDCGLISTNKFGVKILKTLVYSALLTRLNQNLNKFPLLPACLCAHFTPLACELS